MEILNKQMKTVLKELDTIESKINYNELSKKVNTGFYEIEDCILRAKGKRLKKLNIEKILELYTDRTGYESSFNEVRINDYIEEIIDEPIEGLALALSIAEEWEIQLKNIFPKYSFYIVVAYDNKYTTLRFYKSREEEENWIAIDNLDGYIEAIMVKAV